MKQSWMAMALIAAAVTLFTTESTAADLPSRATADNAPTVDVYKAPS